MCSTKLGWNVKKVGKGYEQVVSSNGKTNSTQHLIRCPEKKHYTMEGSRHKQEHQGKNTKRLKSDNDWLEKQVYTRHIDELDLGGKLLGPKDR